MTNDEYLETQVAVVQIAVKTLTLDVDSFLERISTSEAIGPVIDPTLYNRAAEDLATVKGLAEALSEFKKKAEKVFNK